MGLTTSSLYPWDIVGKVNHVEVVLDIFLEGVLKAWKLEFEHGLRFLQKSQNYLLMQVSKQAVFKLFL